MARPALLLLLLPLPPVVAAQCGGGKWAGRETEASGGGAAWLRSARREYELVCYTRLDDITVGEEFAVPEGADLWWLPTPSGEWAHMHAFEDERIMADLARRLRGEAPFSTLPAAPLPN